MSIKFENVDKKFKNKEVFSDFNVEIVANNLVVVKGENGSGKSTFFAMICGIDQNYKGEISLFSKNVVQNDTILLNEISYCPQITHVPNNFLVEDLIKTFLVGINEVVVENLFSKLNIQDLKEKKFSQLSGGEKQKVLLAIAILRPSDILIIDEFDNNLDRKAVSLIIDILKEEKRLVILSTHHEEFKDAEELNINLPKNIIQEEDIKNSNINNTINYDVLKKKYYTSLVVFKTLFAVGIVLLSLLSIYSINSLFETINNDISEYQEAIDYKNNSMVVYAPIASPSIPYQEKDFVVGDDTTPYITQEEYDQLASLEGVTYINDTYDPTASGGEACYEGINVEHTIEPLPEENDYGFTTNQPDKYNNVVSCDTFKPEPRVNDNTPLYKYPQTEDLIYGTMPTEGSDEVIIDDDTAFQLMLENDFTNPEELFTNEVLVDGYSYSSGEQVPTEIAINIVGIYNDDSEESNIIKAYDSDLKNNVAYNAQKIDEETTYSDEYANYQLKGGKMTFEEFKINNPDLHEAVYIEFETEEDAANAYYYINENFNNFDVFCKERVENGVPISYYVDFMIYTMKKIILTLVVLIPIMLLIIMTWKKYKRNHDLFYLQHGVTKNTLNKLMKKEINILFAIASFVTLILSLIAGMLFSVMVVSLIISSIILVIAKRLLRC